MKKFFMIAMMAVVTLTASAQKGFHVTPHLGLGYGNMSNLETPSELLEDGVNSFKDHFNYLVGVEGEYQFSNVFGLSLGADFLYAKSNSISQETYIHGLDIKHNDMSYSFSYINVPVLAQFHFGGFGVKAGLQPAFLVGADYSENGSSVSNTDHLNTVSLSLPVGISYTFRVPLILDLRCAIPLTRQNKDDLENNLKFTSVMLSLGYRF